MRLFNQLRMHDLMQQELPGALQVPHINHLACVAMGQLLLVGFKLSGQDPGQGPPNKRALPLKNHTGAQRLVWPSVNNCLGKRRIAVGVHIQKHTVKLKYLLLLNMVRNPSNKVWWRLGFHTCNLAPSTPHMPTSLRGVSVAAHSAAARDATEADG